MGKKETGHRTSGLGRVLPGTHMYQIIEFLVIWMNSGLQILDCWEEGLDEGRLYLMHLISLNAPLKTNTGQHG